jgi:hypothetical protein
VPRARFLEISAAVFALVAAVFWFLSALKLLPRQRLYWDGDVPEGDPYLRAIRFSAVWAAGFSGLSATRMSARLLLPYAKRNVLAADQQPALIATVHSALATAESGRALEPPMRNRFWVLTTLMMPMIDTDPVEGGVC